MNEHDQDPAGPQNAAEVWDRLQSLPSMKDEPLVWDHRVGGFVPRSQGPPGAPAVPAPPQPPPAPPAGPQHAAAPAPVLDPTMVAPAPSQADRAAAANAASAQGAGRWGDGYAGAGTARPHVTVNGDLPPSAPGQPSSGQPSPAGAYGAAPNQGRSAGRAAPLPSVSPAPRPKKGSRQASGGSGLPLKRSRRWLRRTVIGIFLVPLLLLGALFAFGWYKFGQVPRVDVKAALSPQTGVGQNFLIVGTDSREGITAADPNANAFIGEKLSGVRTDSIMVMHLEGDKQSLLSIPRDLWVKDPKSGQMSRINATFEAGPANLIKAVQNLGIPVHRYVEINFVSFGKLVDAVGGIDIDFPNAARDLNSGLGIDTPGVNHLDGTQSLAYVRARYFEELKANPKDPKKPIWVTDPRSDLGRIERQRTFMTALMNKVTNTRNPVELSSITSAMTVGLKLDNALNFLDALKLAWKLKGFQPESVSLPVAPRRTSGGADVLDLKATEAAPVIQQFAA